MLTKHNINSKVNTLAEILSTLTDRKLRQLAKQTDSPIGKTKTITSYSIALLHLLNEADYQIADSIEAYNAIDQ